ncbi:MAG: ABC transporter permease [Proteobacteria bacterium]|nr:ABC transporter permease [Pseudomonadota bacterium]
MLQILWTEITIKAVAGLVLVLVPLSALAIVGLARPTTGLWPRLTGALLLAIAASIWIGLEYPSARGSIGPAALVSLNLFPAAVLIAALVMGTAAPTRRGQLILGLSAITLTLLAFLEIAHA